MMIERHSSGRPVVLLFGFLGASDRHLAKYADVYESIGSTVLIMKPSISEVAVPRVGESAVMDLLQNRLVPVLEEHRTGRSSGIRSREKDAYGEHRNVFMHCMSNAGWMAMGTMFYMGDTLQSKHMSGISNGEDQNEDEMQREKMWALWSWIRHNLKGIVIDSAPSMATPSIYARGLTSALLKVPSTDVEERHPWALSLASSLTQQYFDNPDVLKRFRKVRDGWSHAVPRNVPQLYLYSSADTLIPSSHVESFMTQQEALGSSVSYQRWNDSEHCEHLKAHPAQYRKIVQTFVQSCVSESDSLHYSS